MKRFFTLLLVFSLLFSLMAKAEFVIDEKIKTTPLTKGVTYTHIKRFTDSGWSNLHLVAADMNEEGLDIKILTNDKLSDKSTVKEFAEREENAVAVINGDYFTNYTKGSANEGLTIKDGSLVTIPSNDSSFVTFVQDEENNFFSDYFSFQIVLKSLANGHSTKVQFYNKLAPENYLKIFDRNFGTHSPGSMDDGYEVVVENGIVTSIHSNEDGVEIPENGYVLNHSLRHSLFLMNYFQVGDEVSLETVITPGIENIRNAVGGGTALIKDGKKVTFTLKDERNPITAIGFDKDKNILYLMNADGRNERAKGMTFSETADFLLSYGCEEAVSLDGGGSTAMAVKKPGESINHVNIQNYYRPVVNAFGITSEKKKGSFSYLLVEADKERVRIPEGITLKVSGYDEYMNEIELKDTEITFSADKNGRFEGNVFYPSESGKVVITAGARDFFATEEIIVMEKAVDENYMDSFYRHSDKEPYFRIGLYGDNGNYKTLFTDIVTVKRNRLAEETDMSVFRQKPSGEIASQVESLALYKEFENEYGSFVFVNNSKGSVSSSDSSQWKKLFSFLENTEKENVFVMFSGSIEKNDRDEIMIITDKIKKELKGKNIFVVSYGEKYGYLYDDGIRYVTMRDLPSFDREKPYETLNNCRYGVFSFNEEGLSFEFLPYFE